MTPLPPDELSKGEEQTMKDWLENYRPVRQRTVRRRLRKIRQELFLRQCIQMQILMPLQGSFFQLTKLKKHPLPPLHEMRSVVSDVSVLSIVLSDATVPQLTLASTADFNQVEEYESDSDDSDNDVDIESEELVIGKPIMTRSGHSLMFRRAQNGKPGHTNLLIKAL